MARLSLELVAKPGVPPRLVGSWELFPMDEGLVFQIFFSALNGGTVIKGIRKVRNDFVGLGIIGIWPRRIE